MSKTAASAKSAAAVGVTTGAAKKEDKTGFAKAVFGQAASGKNVVPVTKAVSLSGVPATTSNEDPEREEQKSQATEPQPPQPPQQTEEEDPDADL